MSNVKLPAFYRGDTPLLTFPLTLNGAPLNLTGYKAIFTLTDNQNPSTDSDVKIQKKLTSIPSPTAGIINIQLTNSDTQTLDPGKIHYWDLQLKDPTDAFIYTILSGTVKVKTDYTRSIS